MELKHKKLGKREVREILRDLERKGELIGLEDWKKHYEPVAKTVEGKKRLRIEGWRIWDLRDFEVHSRELTNSSPKPIS